MTQENPHRAPQSPLVPPGGIDALVADMTVIVSADVPLNALQAKLAEFNQWLPIDGDASETIGHLVETNSTGPLRLGFGAWRDLLLGAQFRSGSGELITAGGKTVKNVAGYDLTKFMVGQRGVFGRLVTITTRTYKKPTAAMVARFPADASIVTKIMPSALRPQWMLFTKGGLDCGYLADEATIEFYASRIETLSPVAFMRRSVEEDIAHRARLWKTDDPGAFRAAVPPAKVLDFAASAQLSDWAADAAFGVVVGVIDPSSRDRLRSAARAAGGSVYFPDLGPGSTELGAAEDALLRRLKDAFDPEGKLAPL